MKYKKIALLTSALLLVGSSAAAKDGVYTATTMGRNGDITVEVTIAKDKIAAVKVLNWSESHPIADLPKEKIPAEMVKYQTTDVDIVSGATFTSFALKQAVEQCLEQAGLDLNAFSKPAPKQPMISTTENRETDVLIIGGGGAGMSAALAAAEAGGHRENDHPHLPGHCLWDRHE